MNHLSEVRSLPCVICHALGMTQDTPTEAHHVRHGAGMGKKNADVLAMSLCVEHHRGPTGIHGDRSAFRQAGLNELSALAITLDWRLGNHAANERKPYKRSSKILERSA